MYDTFVAAMTCVHCGNVSPADGSTNMQTYIRDDRYNIAIPVGFELEPEEVRDSNLIDAGYIATGHPSPDGKKRLIDSWICPHCHHVNLAEVTFDGNRVSDIHAVPMAPPSAEGVQFVRESAETQLLGVRNSDPR